ncbi:MAG: TetR family transcriptional regulator [Frankia sp.]
MDAIVGVVVEILESDGYDAVQLREVARRAHVSLATIYKRFPTRDELIVTAVEHWMAANSYTGLAPPAADESLYDGLMRVFRYVFEPWERSPRMLEAFHRACTGPGRDRLELQGASAIFPVAFAVLEGADPAYVDDIESVLTNMVHALIGRFADGTLSITAILPTLERAVYRLVANNEPEATAVRVGRIERLGRAELRPHRT